jgi:hypothetical protein
MLDSFAAGKPARGGLVAIADTALFVKRGTLERSA